MHFFSYKSRIIMFCFVCFYVHCLARRSYFPFHVCLTLIYAFKCFFRRYVTYTVQKFHKNQQHKNQSQEQTVLIIADDTFPNTNIPVSTMNDIYVLYSQNNVCKRTRKGAVITLWIKDIGGKLTLLNGKLRSRDVKYYIIHLYTYVNLKKC